MIDGIFELLRADGSIVVNKKLAHKIGLNEAMLYSELISRYLYFKNKNQLTVDGFFFNTVEDLKQGTTLGKSPQLKAIRKLESLNLIFTDLRGLPAVRHFKPNLDTTIILNLLNENEEVKKNPEQHNDSNEPQRSRAEGEQNVSKSTDTSISKEKKKVNKKPNKDSNFEKLWALYPLKKGKGHVNKNKKEEINNYHDLEELISYLEQYKKDKDLIINGGWKNLQGGSTFFNNIIKNVNKQKGIETDNEEIKNTKIVEVETMEVNEVKEAKKSKNILF